MWLQRVSSLIIEVVLYQMCHITKEVLCSVCLWDAAYKRSLVANRKV